MRAILLLLVAMLSAGPAAAERLITTISTSRVLITSSYTGAELVIFGAIERDGATVSRSRYDIAIVVRGPSDLVTVRAKGQWGPLWINLDQRKFADLPGYLAVLSTRPLNEVTTPELRERFRIGVEELVAAHGGRAILQSMVAVGDPREREFRAALIRLRTADGLFRENDRGVVFLSENLFRATIPLPARAPLGNYEAKVFLFSDKAVLTQGSSAFEVVKVGFEAATALAAQRQPLLYGVLAVMMAMGAGWLAFWAFRRD